MHHNAQIFINTLAIVLFTSTFIHVIASIIHNIPTEATSTTALSTITDSGVAHPISIFTIKAFEQTEAQAFVSTNNMRDTGNNQTTPNNKGKGKAKVVSYLDASIIGTGSLTSMIEFIAGRVTQSTPVDLSQAVRRRATPQPTQVRTGGLFGHPARVEGAHSDMVRGQAPPPEPVARVDPYTALLRLRPFEEPEEPPRRHRRDRTHRKRKQAQRTRRQAPVATEEEEEEEQVEPEAEEIGVFDPIPSLRGIALTAAVFGAGLLWENLVGRLLGF